MRWKRFMNQKKYLFRNFNKNFQPILLICKNQNTTSNKKKGKEIKFFPNIINQFIPISDQLIILYKHQRKSFPN